MDLVTWTFSKSQAYDEEKPLYINASNSTESLSATQCQTLVRQLVSGLKHQGLKTGETVCMLSFNSIYYTCLQLGIIGSGACFTGANPGYTAHELAHHLRITSAKYFLFSPKNIKAATTAAKACNIPASCLFVLNTSNEEIPEGYQSWTKLLECGEQDWETELNASTTTAAYVSTSGTSGLPKAAILTHSYMVSQAEVIGRVTGGNHKTPQLVVTPPFHVFTAPIQHGIPLKRGTPCYIMPRYEEAGFLNAIETFGITRTVIVPPLLPALGDTATQAQLASLRSIFVGGCCATDGMQQRLYEKLHPSAKIQQVYGLTETGWATVWQGKQKDETGSVGMPLPGTKFRVVGIDGQIIKKDGVQGEIHIKPPHPMRGYLNNPIGTADAFSTDGWVRSGDVGYVKNGKWYVVDRTKDLIKVRGWQVSPAEIEAVIIEHPEVADAAVIGVASDDGTGEVPHGFVVRAKDTEVSEESIKAFLGERLARYKEVDKVIFVDRIPRNPTGKILRRVLRDAREPTIQTPDQKAAAEYSNALRNLEQKEMVRKSRSPSDASNPSRPESLTDASTVTDSPLMSPRVEKGEIELVVKRRGLKRKGGQIEFVQPKRKSARLSALSAMIRN
ncbi:Acyl-CoA ligase [Lachnellula suecica]|uniref:Acyl-CoA ligase n=1 Tax=Lachnellula suecica TaxID=602035 RepID=A0A8T9C314_9HELO|nr:Acyl-CoA ligase [Lachnellula suecica]